MIVLETFLGTMGIAQIAKYLSGAVVKTSRFPEQGVKSLLVYALLFWPIATLCGRNSSEYID
jgi:hypothetical protein